MIEVLIPKEFVEAEQSALKVKDMAKLKSFIDGICIKPLYIGEICAAVFKEFPHEFLDSDVFTAVESLDNEYRVFEVEKAKAVKPKKVK
jgi:hypothetical protein